MKDPFCDNHIRVKENPEGQNCLGHMNEGRCLKCPYTVDNLKYTKEKRLYISLKADFTDGVCREFDAKKGMERELLEIAKGNMAN